MYDQFVKKQVFNHARQFSSEPHGTTNYGEDSIYIMGEKNGHYVPLSYLIKHCDLVSDVSDLQREGFLFSSLHYLETSDFFPWYKSQFGRKLTIKKGKEVGVVYFPNQKEILNAITITDKAFEIFKEQNVLMNGKNLPIQLGEWYAKSIFGLRQIKSSSQRGFDFYDNFNKRVEVTVHWNDFSSPKGVKVKKSLLELSDYSIVMYVSKNFMIRDILLLDSNYILRKFEAKGHTIFLKDEDVSKYFFSVSSKHFDKVINKMMLMKFASPTLVMKLADRLTS